MIVDYRYRAQDALVVLQVKEETEGSWPDHQRKVGWRDAKTEDLLNVAALVNRLPEAQTEYELRRMNRVRETLACAQLVEDARAGFKGVDVPICVDVILENLANSIRRRTNG